MSFAHTHCPRGGSAGPAGLSDVPFLFWSPRSPVCSPTLKCRRFSRPLLIRPTLEINKPIITYLHLHFPHAFAPNPSIRACACVCLCECVWIIWRISWTFFPCPMPSAYLMFWPVDRGFRRCQLDRDFFFFVEYACLFIGGFFLCLFTGWREGFFFFRGRAKFSPDFFFFFTPFLP